VAGALRGGGPARLGGSERGTPDLITTGGTFRFQRRLLFIANSLRHHDIGLEETDDGIWSIYFNTALLAKLDERDCIIRG